MTTSQTVSVPLGNRSYEIRIGSGNLHAVGDFLLGQRRFSRALVVTDSHVEPLYGRPVADGLAEEGLIADLLVVPAG